MTGAEGVGVLLAFAMAAALAGAIAATGPVDTVKARSSHKRPTPTGAGLGLLTATVAGTALAGGSAPSIAVVLTCAAGLGLFGAADDILDLGAGPKLLAQAAFAALLATAAAVTALPLGPGLTVPLGSWLGGAGSVLFLVVLVNAYNFTDGSDGLLGGAAAVAGAGLALAGLLFDVPEVTAASTAFVAAALGFLPWNLRHRVFQGDVGAFFSALVIGGLGLVLASRGAVTPFLVVFTALPLITDVLLTLVVRTRRRERLFEAHRDHLYQLWLRSMGRPHLALAVRVWALTAMTTATGLMLEVYARDWAFAGLLATVALLSAGWLRLRARLAGALPRTAEAGAPRADRPGGAAGTDTSPRRPE